jgi:hypothetical protein
MPAYFLRCQLALSAMKQNTAVPTIPMISYITILPMAQSPEVLSECDTVLSSIPPFFDGMGDFNHKFD